MRPSLILEIASRWLLPTVAVFSLYLLLSGHNAPGGGFVGGLVAAAAPVIAYAAGGTERIRAVLPVPPPIVLGLGLAVAVASAAVPLLLGADVLTSAAWDVRLPLFGEVHVVSALAFDTGVWLVVVGLVAELLITLGDREPADTIGEPR